MDAIHDPIAAVTHPDPWSYYDELATVPMRRDEASGMWIASSAADVSAVLNDPSVRVRPLDAPVPPHLVGTAAGDVFARLVRMSDTRHRASMKAALEPALASVSPTSLDTFCDEVLGRSPAMARRFDPELAEWLMGTVPTLVIARSIGIALADADELVAAAGVLAAAFAPGPPTVDADTADVAATMLRVAVDEVTATGSGIASRFAHRAADADRDDVPANLVGLFFQNFDATAALIGNMLAAPSDTTVEHTLRFDPPIHNTRRFVHAASTVAGCEVGVGDTILLVLAAANRGPATAPVFSFGGGSHLCPARSFAPRLVTNVVDWTRRHRPNLDLRLTGHRRSLNARVPVFASS